MCLIVNTSGVIALTWTLFDLNAKNFEIGFTNLVSGRLDETGDGTLVVVEVVVVLVVVVALTEDGDDAASLACFASCHFRNNLAEISFFHCSTNSIIKETN